MEIQTCLCRGHGCSFHRRSPRQVRTALSFPIKTPNNHTMKPKTIVTIILGICLVLMAGSLLAYRFTHPGISSAELVESSPCSVCAPPSAKQKCIGCGMNLGDATDPYVATWQGKQYRFCCKECAAKFEKDPVAFLAKQPEPASKP